MEAIAINFLVAIVTAVATLLISNYFKQAGRITANLSHSGLVLYKSDNAGGQEQTTFSNATTLTVSLGVDIYNSSDTQKSLRELTIEVRSKTFKASFSTHPSILNKENQAHGAYFPYTELTIVNLPPKELTHLSLNCWLNKEDFYHLGSKVSIYLNALYPNGKKFNTRLLTTELN